MRNIVISLLVLVCVGCHFKDDIEDKQYDEKELKKDLKIFQGILMDMHAGVYAYNSPKEINDLFDSVSNTIETSLNLRTFYTKVDYIVDRIKCIHTEAYFPTEFYDSICNRQMFFPTRVALINNKLIANTDNQNIPLGAEILDINGKAATDIIKNIKKYRHADGNGDDRRSAAINDEFAYYFYLRYGGFKDFAIQYKEDSTNTVLLKNFYAEKLNTLYDNVDFSPAYYLPTDVPYDLTMNDDTKTAVMKIATFNFKTSNGYAAFIHFLDNSFRLIKQSGYKNLIIDIRENGGGFYDATYSALSYLVNEPLNEFDSAFQRFKHLSYKEYIAPEDTARITEMDTCYRLCKKITNRLYKLNDDEISNWIPQPNIFNGKLYVLINGNVASAASTFAAIVKDKSNAILVGEETGGSNNSHNSLLLNFVLPHSQLMVAVPLRRYYQPNNKAMKNRGVLPSKEVNISIQDLIDANDKPMTYIFDSLIAK